MTVQSIKLVKQPSEQGQLRVKDALYYGRCFVQRNHFILHATVTADEINANATTVDGESHA